MTTNNYTQNQFRKHANISFSTIKKLIEDGIITPVEVDGKLLYSQEDLDKVRCQPRKTSVEQRLEGLELQVKILANIITELSVKTVDILVTTKDSIVAINESLEDLRCLVHEIDSTTNEQIDELTAKVKVFEDILL